MAHFFNPFDQSQVPLAVIAAHFGVPVPQTRNDRFSRPTRPQLHQLRQMIDSHKREHGPTWLEDVNNRVSLVHLAQDTPQIIALARQIEARLEYLATEPIPVVDETWWFHRLENLG